MYQSAKYLTKVLSPLVGKNQHHVKNSEHFARLIEDLEIPPGRMIRCFGSVQQYPNRRGSEGH